MALAPATTAEAGEIRVAKVGEPFVYALEGTPGTGAEWWLAIEESHNLQHVMVEALGYGDPLNDLIGGPALFTFEVTPAEPGITRLVFVYGRPWEAEPIEIDSLLVFVRAVP